MTIVVSSFWHDRRTHLQGPQKMSRRQCHSFCFPRLWTHHQEVMPKSCLSHAFWSSPILNANVKTPLSKSEPFISAVWNILQLECMFQHKGSLDLLQTIGYLWFLVLDLFWIGGNHEFRNAKSLRPFSVMQRIFHAKKEALQSRVQTITLW